MTKSNQTYDCSERVTQIHRHCLNAIYATNYFKEVSKSQSKYARHSEFAIGLGAALSGGSGLGILGDPKFAWVCGIVTTVSLILTVAKSAYDWPGRIRSAANMIENYGRLSGKYILLIDDLNFKKTWSDEVDSRFRQLREEEAAFSNEDYPELPLATQKAIQNGIKARIDYKSWWTPAEPIRSETAT